MKKRYIAALILIVGVLLVSLFLLIPQPQQAVNAQQAVQLGDEAEAQVNTLIDLIYVNQTALDVLEAQGLLDQLNGNVSEFNLGVANMSKAHEQLNVANYNEATTFSLQAMTNFRSAFTAIHQILQTAGLESENLFDSQLLVEAVQRARERVQYLRTIVPENDFQAILQLNQADEYLNMNVSALIKEGNISFVQSNLSQANQLIANVYQNLKIYAGSLNGARIANYCLKLQQSASHAFSYGHGHGVNVNAVLGNLGYQNENDFNQQLQQQINLAQSATTFVQAMQYLQQAGNMVMTMNQAMMNAAGGGQNGNGP